MTTFRLLLTSIISGSLAVSVPVLASNAPSADADSDKLICKHQAQTGTRFKKKKCYTKAEWEKVAEASKRAAAEMANRPSINQSGNGE